MVAKQIISSCLRYTCTNCEKEMIYLFYALASYVMLENFNDVINMASNPGYFH